MGVQIEAQNLQGKKFKMTLDGFEARVFQHEFDHLDGVLFHDRMTKEVRATIHRLEPRRQGIFLALADHGTCQSCYVRVRPQVFQEIRTASVVHNCDSCKRFLYHASLASEPAGDVEAANGGAV